MTLRPEEIFAQGAFGKFLSGNISSAPGSDPPDLVFVVGGSRWGVEVTTFHMYLERSGGEASHAAFDAQIRKMRETLSKVVTPGKGYVLCVGRWLDNANLRKLEQWAKDYIEVGGVGETHFDGIEQIWIKAGDPTGRVGTIAGIMDQMPLPDGKQSLPADIQAVVDYGAKRIIEDKGPKLAKVARDYDRTVLLIVNDRSGYPFLDSRNLKAVLAKVPISTFLRGGVYLVDGDGSVNLVG